MHRLTVTNETQSHPTYRVLTVYLDRMTPPTLRVLAVYHVMRGFSLTLTFSRKMLHQLIGIATEARWGLHLSRVRPMFQLIDAVSRALSRKSRNIVRTCISSAVLNLESSSDSPRQTPPL